MWKRLPSPNNNTNHNCNGVDLDDGVILTQSDHHVGSICRLKLILKSLVIGTGNDLPSMEAECVEVQKPSFHAHPHAHDKAKAIEHAKTLPLASLSLNITAVKLRSFSELSPNGKSVTYDHIVCNRIWNLIEGGYQAYMDAAQVTNGYESKPRTPPPPEPCKSSSNVCPISRSRKNNNRLFKRRRRRWQHRNHPAAHRMTLPTRPSRKNNLRLLRQRRRQ